MVARKRNGSSSKGESSKKKTKKKDKIQKSRVSRLLMEEEDSKEGSDSLGDIDWEEDIEVDTPCLDEFAPPTRNSQQESKGKEDKKLEAVASVTVPVETDPTVSAAVAAIDLLNTAGENPCEESSDQFYSPEDRVLVRDIVSNEWVGGCVKDVDGEGQEVLVALDLPGRDLEWVSIDKDRIKPENDMSEVPTSTDQTETAESVIGSISSVITGSLSKVTGPKNPVELPPKRSRTTPSVALPKKKKRRAIIFGLNKKPSTSHPSSQPSRSSKSAASSGRNRIKTPKGAGYEISKATSRRMPIWKTEKSSAPDVKTIRKCKFKEGEKILAKWSDHRMQKFPAVIKKISGPGQYDVLFYDGFEKTILEENLFKCSLEEEEKYRHAKPSEADFLIEEENLNKAERRQKKRKVFDGYISEMDFKRRKKSTDDIAHRHVPSLPSTPISTPRQRKRKLEIVDTPPPPVHADAAKALEETGSCNPLMEKVLTDSAVKTPLISEDPPKVIEPESVTDESIILEHYPLRITCHDGVLRKTVLVTDASIPKGWSKHVINWLGTTYSSFLFSPDGYAVHNQTEFEKYKFKSELAKKKSSGKIRTSISHPVVPPSPACSQKVEPSVCNDSNEMSLPTGVKVKEEPNVSSETSFSEPVAETTTSASENVTADPSTSASENVTADPTTSASEIVEADPTKSTSENIKADPSTSDSGAVVIKTEPGLMDTDEGKAEDKPLESTSEGAVHAVDGSVIENTTAKEPEINVKVETDESCSERTEEGIPTEVKESGEDKLSSETEVTMGEKSTEVAPTSESDLSRDLNVDSGKEEVKVEEKPTAEESISSEVAKNSHLDNSSIPPADETPVVNFDVPSLDVIEQLQLEQIKWPMRGRYRKWINKTLDEKRKASKKIRILPPSRAFPIKRVRTLLPKHRQQLANMGKAIDPGKVWSCPKESCGKKFRKENLLQMHIKHYHAELSQGIEGPKVVDLAVARSVDSLYASPLHMSKPTSSYPVMNRHTTLNDVNAEENSLASPRRNVQQHEEVETTPPVHTEERKPTIKTLLPRPAKSVPAPAASTMSPINVSPISGTPMKSEPMSSPSVEPESEILAEPKHHVRESGKELTSTPMKVGPYRRRHHHHFPHHRYHHHEKFASMSSMESNEYLGGEGSPLPELTEDGVLIERLKSEEIINCICGSREEDGLMVQCEICLCWQHGICTGIEQDSDVPDRYVCRTCRNPMRVRSSHKFHYARQYLTQAKLPRFSHRTCKEDVLKQRERWLARSFELSASLRQLQRIESSLSTKINIAQETDHPKLYMWSTNWEDHNMDQSSDFSMKVKPELNGVKDSTVPGGAGPVGEAPIESEDCRIRLLDHIENYQQHMDGRLSYLQAHIASLESEDADLANEESCSDHHPLLKQAVYMLMRDLTTLRTAITLS